MKFYDRESEQQLLKEVLDQSKREALQLGWGETHYDGSTYLAHSFDKEQSTIHIYASDGTIVKRISYLDITQVREIIRDEETKKCD